MTMDTGRSLAIAVERLRTAGVPSPESDARQLLAQVAEVEPNRIILLDTITADQQERFGALVEQRAARIPLQHLTGTAHFRYCELAVGPGVFVPRPETEVMTGWAIDKLQSLIAAGESPLVVELCTGSGAISKAIAREVPGCRVHAVEVSEDAVPWAERNLADTGVAFHLADMANALPELDGTVDLVIANPPYIPLDAYESVTPEVRDHDPMIALFSGDDGLDAMRVLAVTGARLLKAGGLICAEHAEVQEASAPAVFVGQGQFHRVRDHRDLAGRPRFVTAVRRPTGGAGTDGTDPFHGVWQDWASE